VAAWKVVLENTSGPSALVLTRQKLPVLDLPAAAVHEGVARGAYVVAEGDDPKALLIATGSEVSLAVEAHRELAAKGVSTRVVSMPSWERFEAQDADYRESILPSSIRARLAIEAGTTHGWHRYVGLDGDVLGLDGFGASAPAKDLAEHFGFTSAEVVRRVEGLLGD
jgi:transketolase